MSICCGCPVDITHLLEDCYGLMGLKVTWTDLNCGVCVVFLVGFFLVGGGRVKLFHYIVRTGVYDILCV